MAAMDALTITPGMGVGVDEDGVVALGDDATGGGGVAVVAVVAVANAPSPISLTPGWTTRPDNSILLVHTGQR